MYPLPPGMKKLKSQVNVTFWFWLMYPPPGLEKLNQVDAMNAIENNWGQQVHFTNLPPPHPSLHTYTSSLWNTLKRKPLFFKFSWNFGST